MIPKIIHYCWFGGKPLPDEVKKYMETWKKYCPYYEITEWNESNFDVNQNQYCREAYEAGKWAFVSDYARLKILYDYGGMNGESRTGKEKHQVFNNCIYFKNYFTVRGSSGFR